MGYQMNLSEASVLWIKLGAITFFLIYYGAIYQKILHKNTYKELLKKRKNDLLPNINVGVPLEIKSSLKIFDFQDTENL